MSDVTLLAQAISADPTDDTAALVYADALQESDDEAGAAEVRREVAAKALRAEVIAAGFASSRVYTLGTARTAKGPEARTAERLLTRTPGEIAADAARGRRPLLVVVFGDDAVTKTGLRKGADDSSLMYYRKSSGGKWGRSVQTHRVSL